MIYCCKDKGNEGNKLVENKTEGIRLQEHFENADAVQRFLAHQIGENFDEQSSMLVSNLYNASLYIRHDIEKEILADEKISWTAMLMMYTLYVWGESETKMIAKRLKLAPSSVTSLTNTLEKRQLVVRVYKPTDRRLVLVKLTEAGETLLQKLSKQLNERQPVLVSNLNIEEIITLNNLLQKMLNKPNTI